MAGNLEDRTKGAPVESDRPAVESDRPAVEPNRRAVEARRPMIERIGLAAIAVVLAGLFAVISIAAFAGGEPFLALMAAAGCAMTLWAGAVTLVRG
jgi:hypothetical protein